MWKKKSNWHKNNWGRRADTKLEVDEFMITTIFSPQTGIAKRIMEREVLSSDIKKKEKKVRNLKYRFEKKKTTGYFLESDALKKKKK